MSTKPKSALRTPTDISPNGANAVADALAPFGVTITRLPLTPAAMFRGNLSADILAHESRILVLKDVTVKHERVLARSRSMEGD